jgi:hypothetical protein
MADEHSSYNAGEAETYNAKMAKAASMLPMQLTGFA